MIRIKLLGKPLRHWVAVGLLWLTGLLSNGCQTDLPNAEPFADAPVLQPSTAVNLPPLANPSAAPTNNASVKLRPGDSLSVTYSDTPTPILPHEGRIKEDGTITIPPYSQTFVAAGKTVRELEQEIRAQYVPKFFLNLTILVTSQNQYYSVDGEVKTPNRIVYTGPTTVLGAIASAGGFTDYAQKKKVRIIRADGTKTTVNCVKALEKPELDLPIYPGDKIIVPRRYY